MSSTLRLDPRGVIPRGGWKSVFRGARSAPSTTFSLYFNRDGESRFFSTFSIDVETGRVDFNGDGESRFFSIDLLFPLFCLNMRKVSGRVRLESSVNSPSSRQWRRGTYSWSNRRMALWRRIRAPQPFLCVLAGSRTWGSKVDYISLPSEIPFW